MPNVNPTPFTFSVTDWLDRDVGDTLTFEPSDNGSTLFTARIDNSHDGERVHLTAAQTAFLAVELTRAVGLRPPIELENLARSSAPDAPAEVTTQPAAPDPRDALLREAFDFLRHIAPALPTANANDLALKIASYLLGPSREAR